jgi:hypothetical protein
MKRLDGVSRILNAIFGWAVRALFGPNTARAQTFLSVVVGAAVAWSVVFVGAVASSILGLMTAPGPTSRWIAPWTIRIVLVGAALLIPPTVGISDGPSERRKWGIPYRPRWSSGLVSVSDRG